MNPDSERQMSASESVQKDWWLLLVVGAAMVLVGVFAATAPFAAALALTLVLGWVLIFSGIAHTIHAFRIR